MKRMQSFLQVFNRWGLILACILATPLAYAQVADGRYNIVSRYSGLAVEVANNSNDNGANIQQWALGSGLNQQFDITSLGNGYYAIRPAHSGKSMDVWEWSAEPGGDIRQHEWLGGTNQQWLIQSVGSGYHRIVSRHSGLALDVWEWSMNSGGDIRQWTVTSGHNQHWEFQLVSGGGASSSANNAPAPSSATALPVIEDFSAVDSSGFFSANYKGLATNSGISFYYALAGSNNMVVADNSITFGNGRFSVANTTPTVTTSSSNSLSNTSGELDLSQPYRISFCVNGTSGNNSKKFQIYVDNNTTGQANSAHGNASRIYDVTVGSLSNSQRVVVNSTVGTATSFLQFRVESEASVTISNLWIEHQSSAQTQPSCGGSNGGGVGPGIPSGERTFYISTNGNNNNTGTEASPFRTLNHAASIAQPGDVFVMRGGTYGHTSRIDLNRNGTASRPIYVVNYPGETPVFNFTGQEEAAGRDGIRLNANYWRLVGLHLTRAGGNGFRVHGSNNIIERCAAYDNRLTGFHLEDGANNLFKNNDSYRNINYRGRVGNMADGFAAKYEALGPGNVFYGNRAWENSDDGFDFWMASSVITLENNWAFDNGNPAVFGNPSNFEGNGNGFKLGGNQVAGNHIVIRNMAFDNNHGNSSKGFDHNNNTGAMTLLNNSAFNNGRNYTFPNAPSSGSYVFRNNLSLNGAVQIPSGSTAQANSWQLGTPTTSMFFSVNTSQARNSRQADGSLPNINLLRPRPGTYLVDGGVDVGLPYYGSAPDIGAVEYQP